MRATHWLPAHQPQMAQAIASIVMNFGSLERQSKRPKIYAF